MATYDMTTGSTVSTERADSIAALPSAHSTGHPMRLVEAILDIDNLVKNNVTQTTGDVYQLLEIPAGTMVLFAGAEVEKAFDGTSPLADIGFAGADTIVDGGDVSSTGFLAAGTNGGPNDSDAGTFTQLVSTADTIDVTLAYSGSLTEGRLRVYACVVDVNSAGSDEATEVDRDQLA